MTSISRRDFVRRAAIAAAATRLSSTLLAETSVASPTASAPVGPLLPLRPDVVDVHWLEATPSVVIGNTWGVPWAKGRHRAETTFRLQDSSGEDLPVQSWPLATWPDGSLKWTAHAIGALARLSERYELKEGAPAMPERPLQAADSATAVEIDTGVMQVRMPKQGAELVEWIKRGDKICLRAGKLVAIRQNSPSESRDGPWHRESFESRIGKVSLEQHGPVRGVVKIEGDHQARSGESTTQARARWLPFVLRLYFHAGSDAVRVVHSFIFDGDEQKDFIAGLGLRFAVPMRDALYDRHVRFGGEGAGLWAEAVQGITGLRRDPGAEVKAAQMAGAACPPLDQWSKPVREGLKYVPVWGDYTLTQLSADGFEIRKRTREGFGWISAAAGRRASGWGYIGGASGGVAFGVRNFWQSFPGQIDVAGAATDEAETTLWFWSPEAAAMDLRFYHDGMGEDTYAKQTEGLNITYEDFEPGFGTPHGIARTSEVMLWALGATPTRERSVQLAEATHSPAQLVCRPEYYASANIFGGIWGLPDRAHPQKARIEDELDFYFDYYRRQIEQHHWYGFWNYGDFRHTYDEDRHVWRYDVGGFAWDNSELSPDLWLWYSFLRTGRADIYRVAEAMTRHTGEVDVYHLGRFRGLGTRHGVQHWGDSAKQVRISTAAYRRFYYYLTGDERVGDLLRELLDCDVRASEISPGRKLGHPDPRYPGNISFGTDWCSFAAAWLTEWERTGDPRWRDKIVTGMQSIGAMPQGWFSSGGGYDPATGKIYPHDDRASASHLNAVFGAVEINAELLQLLDVPEYRRAWLQYCEVYNADPEEQVRRFGKTFPNATLRQGHARLTAYAAREEKDAQLAARAWREFFSDGESRREQAGRATRRVEGPAVLNPIDEAPHISTNSTAQFGLAAIQCLALVGDALRE